MYTNVRTDEKKLSNLSPVKDTKARTDEKTPPSVFMAIRF